MTILVTGSAGYTGRGIVEVLRACHEVRGLDIKPCEGLADNVVGDLTDLDICRGAVAGVDTVVLCHMAPNPTGYRDPVQAIDINVKGTANLYHAMAEHGVHRAVLISTIGVCPGNGSGESPVPGSGPYNYGNDLYRLSKVLQECVAVHYSASDNIVTTFLRPSYICYESRITKYGKEVMEYSPTLVDPRDVGTAALKALALEAPGQEAFLLLQDDAEQDMTATHQRLGWHPRYTFDDLREETRGPK